MIQPLSDNVTSESSNSSVSLKSTSTNVEEEKLQQPVVSDPSLNQSISPSVTKPQVGLSPVSIPAQAPGGATVCAAPIADTPAPEIKGSSSTSPQFLTGSQLEQEKVNLPIGIYIIQAWAVISLILDQIGTSQTSVYTTIALFIDLLVCVGLFFRMEAARKLMLWLSTGTVILSVISLLLLVGVQQRIEATKANFQTAVSKINQAETTVQQRQQIADLQTQLNTLEKKAGKSIDRAYIVQGITIVAETLVVVYLSRPKVKGVFRELEK